MYIDSVGKIQYTILTVTGGGYKETTLKEVADSGPSNFPLSTADSFSKGEYTTSNKKANALGVKYVFTLTLL